MRTMKIGSQLRALDHTATSSAKPVASDSPRYIETGYVDLQTDVAPLPQRRYQAVSVLGSKPVQFRTELVSPP